MDILREKVDGVIDEVIAIRRELHMYPELSEQEFETKKRICAYLDAWGVEYETGYADTGVVALVRGKKPGKTIGARADIDALPIQEKNDLDYISKNPGVMHACGHDVHTAIHLGLIKIFKEMEEELEGNVKVFFQPAEETIGGAQRMIDDGCLEDPYVDYVVSLHVAPAFETGQIEIKKGKVNAATNEFTISVKGRAGHAAYPETAVDAIVIAGNIIMALQTLVSRNTSPLDPIVLTMGQIHGGVKNNVIAEEVKISGTLRTLDPETRVFAKRRMEEIAQATAQVYGGEAEIYFPVDGAFMPLINDDEVVDTVVEVAQEVLGEENIFYKEKPSMGGDDFSFFTHERPGCYYFLGTGNKEKGCNYPAHNENFKVDEDAIKVGLELQLKSIMKLLNK